MLPSIHFLLSIFMAALLYPIFGWQVLMVFVGGVLIDVDHYLLYALRFRKFSLKACYKYHHIEVKKNHHKDIFGALLIFHTVEFLSLSALLSIYSNIALMFTMGMIGHYILDIIERYKLENSLITNPSIVSWFIKKRFKSIK